MRTLFIIIAWLISLPFLGAFSTQEERTAEDQFSKLIESNEPLMNEIYNFLPSSEHGKILNVDFARMLYAPFNDGGLGANQFSTATHPAASKFIEKRFFNEIARIHSEDSTPTMLFLGGGGGSGKSFASKQLPDIFQEADMILDGTMKNYAKSSKKINIALDNGLKVYVVYVHRPIELATLSMLERAIRTGRSIPVIELAKMHFQAQDTMIKLMEDYRYIVHFYVVDNSSKDFSTVTTPENPLEFLKSIKYQSESEAIQKASQSYLNWKKQQKNLPDSAIYIFEKDM